MRLRPVLWWLPPQTRLWALHDHTAKNIARRCPKSFEWSDIQRLSLHHGLNGCRWEYKPIPGVVLKSMGLDFVFSFSRQDGVVSCLRSILCGSCTRRCSSSCLVCHHFGQTSFSVRGLFQRNPSINMISGSHHLNDPVHHPPKNPRSNSKDARKNHHLFHPQDKQNDHEHHV